MPRTLKDDLLEGGLKDNFYYNSSTQRYYQIEGFVLRDPGYTGRIALKSTNYNGDGSLRNPRGGWLDFDSLFDENVTDRFRPIVEAAKSKLEAEALSLR